MRDFIRGVARYLADGRLWVLLALSVAVALVDAPYAETLAISLVPMVWIAAFSHLIRKLLFPYLDLRTLAEQGLQTPHGAAMVFLGVCVVLAAMVLSSAVWIGR